MTNLNKIGIPTDTSDEEPLRDYSLISGNVEVVFRGLEERLIREIQASDIVVGCVAWLTNKNILRALAQVNCCVVVQKEDFLRPDGGGKTELQKLYDQLRSGADRWEFWPPLGGMTTNGDPTVEGVRCVGNHNRDKNPAFPRAHHKFVVFGKKLKGARPDEFSTFKECVEVRHEDVLAGCQLDEDFLFDRVWTGSFNFTQNAGNSFENALIVNDARVARAYLGEFAQVASLSEPLNWDDEWCIPEWRLGT